MVFLLYGLYFPCTIHCYNYHCFSRSVASPLWVKGQEVNGALGKDDDCLALLYAFFGLRINVCTIGDGRQIQSNTQFNSS